MNNDKEVKNIVELNARSTSNINQGVILPKIYKLFLQGLKPTIREYYDKLDDSLFDLAEKAQSNQKQNHYFEAMREVRKKKELMVRKFSENVQHVFKLFKQGQFEYFSTDENKMSASDNLSLVDEKELDQKLASTNLTEKANAYLHQHLYAFEKRFTLLAGGIEVKMNQIPVSPAIIVGSFAKTFEHLSIDATVHIIMLKLFERSLIQNLVEPYNQINELLIKEGILPSLRFNINRKTSHSSQPNSAQANTMAPEDSYVQTVNDTFQQNQSQITDQQYQAIAAAFSQKHNPQHVQMPIFDASLVNNALRNLQFETLNSFNSNQQSLSPTEVKDAIMSQLKSMNQDGEEKQVKQQDEDTIDLIGMLFQFLVDDRNLPDRIQALLAKLQIPYLHIALKDRMLFSNKDNNARKLLDIIANASIGWNEEDDKGGKFITKIESIVQVILQSKQDEIDFPHLIEDFEVFSKKTNKRTQIIEKRTSEKVLGQERIFNAKQHTADLLKSKMQRHTLPKLVTELLLTPWANVLILAHLRHKDEPEKIENFTKFVDKLIFVSVKDKKKNATSSQISHVCDQLNQGLRMVAFDESSIREKSQELHDLLLRINNIEECPPEKEHEVVAPKKAFDTDAYVAEDEPEIVHFIANKNLNKQDTEVEHIEDEYHELAKNLTTGEWVEFFDCVDKTKSDDTLPAQEAQNERDNVRAKLSWISPISHKLLFVNARGVKVTDKDVDELAHELRENHATILQQIPLFDRAMSAIADKVINKDNAEEQS